MLPGIRSCDEVPQLGRDEDVWIIFIVFVLGIIKDFLQSKNPSCLVLVIKFP